MGIHQTKYDSLSEGNNTQSYNQVLDNWLYTGNWFYEPSNCKCCGAAILYNYEIQNKESGEKKIVGSTCITDFIPGWREPSAYDRNKVKIEGIAKLIYRYIGSTAECTYRSYKRIDLQQAVTLLGEADSRNDLAKNKQFIKLIKVNPNYPSGYMRAIGDDNTDFVMSYFSKFKPKKYR